MASEKVWIVLALLTLVVGCSCTCQPTVLCPEPEKEPPMALKTIDAVSTHDWVWATDGTHCKTPKTFHSGDRLFCRWEH